MAVTIVATAKSASANSYGTLAEAETYMEGRTGTVTWDAATDDQKNRALVEATNRLDQLDFFGGVTASDQRLKWPRVGVYDADGRSWDQDVVPRPVKNAQVELALALVNGDLEHKDTGLEGFDSVRVGPLSVDINHGREPGALPRAVRRWLVGLMVSAGQLNVRVVRG
jgi:hypothetical protein